MKEVADGMGILEGQRGHMFFTYNLENLRTEKYFTAGRYVAWSLTHGGPGLPLLDRTMLCLMVNSSRPIALQEILQWLPDHTAKTNLEKVTCFNIPRDRQLPQG